MTSSVQFGFIAGTLVFAFFTLADRYSPRKVYFACSMLGALTNLGLYLLADGLTSMLILRFITGVFLAGVYHVGDQAYGLGQDHARSAYTRWSVEER